MKPATLLPFALLLTGALAGCSTAKPTALLMRGPDREGIQLPVSLPGYHELYSFIAAHEGLPTDADSLFKLAADSTTEIYGLNNAPNYAWVVTPHFYDGGIYDEIRGAQGNGGIYVLVPLTPRFTFGDTDHGFKLVGIAEGNALRWSSLNQRTRLVTSWHMSAAEHPESIYEWNGRFFEFIDSGDNK